MLLGFNIIKSVQKPQSDDSGQMIELDASDINKFSRHLIITFPHDQVFTGPRNVLKFVSLLCDYIKSIASINIDVSNISPDARVLRKLFFF